MAIEEGLRIGYERDYNTTTRATDWCRNPSNVFLRFSKFLMNSDVGSIPRVAGRDNDFFSSSSLELSLLRSSLSRTPLLASSEEAPGRLPHPGRRDRWLQRATVIAEIVWLTKMSLGFHYFQPPWGTTAQQVYAMLFLFFPLPSSPHPSTVPRNFADPVVPLCLSREIQPAHEVGRLHSRLLGNCHKGSTGLTSSAIDICEEMEIGF